MTHMHRANGKGNFIIQLQLGRYGRFKASSGTDNPEKFARLVEVIRKLRANGHWNELGELANRRIHPLELLDRYDTIDKAGAETRRLIHRQQTPIIMFSASDIEKEARQAGANAFLRKPEDLNTMAETIAQLLARKPRPAN